MALYDTLCFLLFGTFLSSLPMFHGCEKQEDCTFPVYPTDFCPNNQTEWDRRSSDLNCNETNSYMCVPNEKFTELLEFCYKEPKMLIVQDACLFLSRSRYDVNVYDCRNFEYGCPSYHYTSSKIYKYPSCIHVKDGCFVAEPSCKSQPPQRETQTNVQTIAITLGVIIPTCFLCILFVFVINGRYCICKLKKNEESPPDEASSLLSTTGRNIEEKKNEESPPDEASSLLSTTEQNIEGYHICKEKKKEESPPDEARLLLSTTEQNIEESKINRAIFKQWQEDNDNFISTRACNEVEKLIKSQNLVIVTGNPGSGKSAIIQHIALSYRSGGWTVKPVYSVKEIIDAFPPPYDFNRGTLLVFNDPFGNESFDEEKSKLWKDHEEWLKCYLRRIKMLVSCRRYILNDARDEGILKDTSCIIDISDEQHKLDNVEKQKMFEKYSSNSGFVKEDSNEIIRTEEYFPLLCKLYFSDGNKQKMGLRSFKEPFNICEEQIRSFRKECKENYCALVLLVLCNNQLCLQDILKNDHLREKFELALKLCDLPHTALYTIGDALKNLEGFFVKKIGDTYHFYHDFVMEVSTYVFGTDYPLETIRYADIGFLRRRVNLKSSTDNRKNMKLENGDQKNYRFTIFLKDKHVSDLVDRLFNEIFGERMLDVVLNPCMRNEKVATYFIHKLKDRVDKLINLLAKKQLNEKFGIQKDDTASEQLFYSKLDFLFYKDEVSILCAIIVFCHTTLSLYCLKFLQGMQYFLPDGSLFSAVCCNGSMDLFSVFTQEQIEWFLMEKWGQFYPIHIVSQFHNHEILRKLIHVTNNVNLRTRTEYGYTPLMLAVYNTDTSEKINKETRNQSIDITVELLLTHGADINLCHPFLGSPLHIVSDQGNDYTAQLLLDKGADINSCDLNSETPLHKASEGGHESTVQLLLDKGADINPCDLNKETPLHKASEGGHESTVQLLLDKGADINSCDLNKQTPLHKASIQGRKSIVQLLLDKGADINSFELNKETPLHEASYWGHDSTVQLLLDKGADINACDLNKETPLHKASEGGHASTVQLLLEKGADINPCDLNKETPLHKAIEGGHDSTVQLLLEKGAAINACDTNKETPLHKASEEGNESSEQLLLDKGAAINSSDENKEAPLHKASEKKNDSTVQLTLNEGADIN